MSILYFISPIYRMYVLIQLILQLSNFSTYIYRTYIIIYIIKPKLAAATMLVYK